MLHKLFCSYLDVMCILKVIYKVLFTVDLTENLSSDLKKEGLCGKTLTLKLKTSSFEVLFDSSLKLCA